MTGYAKWHEMAILSPTDNGRDLPPCLGVTLDSDEESVPARPHPASRPDDFPVVPHLSHAVIRNAAFDTFLVDHVEDEADVE
jgi:hypothetical protein